jgi:hypothetical protein
MFSQTKLEKVFIFLFKEVFGLMKKIISYYPYTFVMEGNGQNWQSNFQAEMKMP